MPSSREKIWKSADGRVELRLGDSRELLARLPDQSIDLIFTDPPYGHNNNNGDLISSGSRT